MYFVVKRVIVEGCKTSNAGEFKKVGETKELGGRDGNLQNESLVLSDAAPFTMLKFIIQEGHDDFASVHNISFN